MSIRSHSPHRGALAGALAVGVALASLAAVPATAADDAAPLKDRAVKTPMPSEPTQAVGIIVKRAEGATAQGVAASVRETIADHFGLAKAAKGARGLTSTPVSVGVDAYGTEEMGAKEANALAAEIAKADGVEWASPDFTVQADEVPWPSPVNDPEAPRLRNLWDTRSPGQDQALAALNPTPWPAGGTGTKAPALWPATTGAGVTVAVIDSGVRFDHPDLAPNLLPGYDFVSAGSDGSLYTANDGDGRDADASDPGDWSDGTQCASSNSSWHGTHVAGTIAAVANNGVGVVGVAPSAKILPVRALGRCGGYTSDILSAMVWAAGGTVPGVPTNPNPAKVINMSLGGNSPTCPAPYAQTISTVRSLGATIVVSAGNDAASASLKSPANCAGVVTVGATSDYGDLAAYSNYGAAVDVSAPGGDRSFENKMILSTVDAGTTTPAGPTYGEMQGTSMATPAVAGTAALLASIGSFTPDQMEAALRGSVMPFPTSAQFTTWGSTCTTSLCGTGIIDMTAVPAPLTAPVVSGEAKIGQTLTATTGTWMGPALPITVTWYADGVVVGEGASYTVGPAAIGKSLTAFAHVATGPYATIGSRSTALPVAGKLSSRIKLKFPKRMKRGSKAIGKVKVKVSGATATGQVKIWLKVGRKKQSVKLNLNSKGVAKFRVTISKRTARFKLKAKYLGSSAINSSSTGWKRYRTRR